MTTLNLQNNLPATPTGLTATSAVGTVTLLWTQGSAEVVAYNVYRGTTSSSGSASLIGTVTTNTFVDASPVAGTVYYYFVRAANVFGVLSDFSASASITAVGVTSSDLTAPTSISSVSSSTSTSASSGSLANYNDWESFGSIGFTASDNQAITLSAYTWASLSGASSLAQIEVYCRFRLYDNTIGADVPGGTSTYLACVVSLSTYYGGQNVVVNGTRTFETGFRGILISGHSYTWYCEWSKQRTGSSTVTVSINGFEASANSAVLS